MKKYIRRWKAGPPSKVEGVYILQVHGIYPDSIVAATISRQDDAGNTLVLRYLGFSYALDMDSMSNPFPSNIRRHIGPFKFPSSGKPRIKRKVK